MADVQAPATPPTTTGITSCRPEASPDTEGLYSEHLLQFVRLDDVELIVAAVLRLLVGSPPQEDRRVAEAVALHVVVLHLADALDAQRLPGQILAGTPAALAAGHARAAALRASPLAPRVFLHRVRPQRLQLLRKLLARLHRERGRDADVMQRAFVVVQPEEQRA